MDFLILIESVFIGYLLGCISFTRVLAKLMGLSSEIEKTEIDIRGSEEKFSFHSVSATSMAVNKGPVFGLMVSLLDMLKAYLPVYYFLSNYPNDYYYLVSSLFCIVGHNFPVFYKFKGGRGMSPLFGSLLVLDWRSILVTMSAGLIFGLVVLQDMFFAFTSGPLFLIPFFYITKRSFVWVLYSLLINIVFWVAIIPEIRTYFHLRKKGVLQEAERIERTNPRKGGVLGRFAQIFKIIKDDEDSKK